MFLYTLNEFNIYKTICDFSGCLRGNICALTITTRNISTSIALRNQRMATTGISFVEHPLSKFNKFLYRYNLKSKLK